MPGGPSAPTSRVYGQRHQPGTPRQEYVDAFDDDVFRTGTPGQVPGARTESGPQSEVPQPPPDGPGESTRNDEGGAGDDERTSRRAKGGWGRTFSGVTAAAVITVLVLIVAAEVTDGDAARDTRPAGRPGLQQPDEEVSRSESRSEAVEDSPAPWNSLSFQEKLDRQLPLSPKLRGSGEFRTIGGEQRGAGSGHVVRYRVDVERKLPLDGTFFAQLVHTTLNDERSWVHNGNRRFDRVSSGSADFTITLASPGTTADWCAKSQLDTTVDNVSCDSAATERVMINAYRWAQGSETYGDRIGPYRQMLVNHEVGHRLGWNHLPCPREGALAPVMMQQTKSLSTEGRLCRPNPWPFP